MTAPRPAAPPTLTEVIDLPDRAMAPIEPMPLPPDSMSVEELEAAFSASPAEPLRPMRLAEVDAQWLARLLDELRPALREWLDTELQRALLETMPELSERLRTALHQRLERELPSLLERAIAEPRRRMPDLR